MTGITKMRLRKLPRLRTLLFALALALSMQNMSKAAPSDITDPVQQLSGLWQCRSQTIPSKVATLNATLTLHNRWMVLALAFDQPGAEGPAVLYYVRRTSGKNPMPIVAVDNSGEHWAGTGTTSTSAMRFRATDGSDNTLAIAFSASSRGRQWMYFRSSLLTQRGGPDAYHCLLMPNYRLHDVDVVPNRR